MKLAVWSGLGRLGPYVTGVGKHIVNMTLGLAARNELDARLLLSAEHWKGGEDAFSHSPLSDIPGINLPFRRRHLDALWQAFGAPAIDRWADGADWIYCPNEAYVPVRGARYAVTVHDLYALEGLHSGIGGLGRLRRYRTLKRALDEATVVFAVSDFTKGRIVELLKTPPEKIRVVRNGVEAEFFQTPEGETCAGSGQTVDRYMLSVGGLTRKKGAPDLLKFAEALAHVAADITIVLTGPVETEFEAPLRAARNVRHLQRGFSDAEMQRLVRRAFASVTLSEYEGFGIPAIEAMAAGVPVIAARRSALPEVVGDAGILVDPAKPREICELVLALGRDEGLRADLIAKGHRRAQQYSWSACVERVADTFQELGDGGQE